ncbi:MAG: hypothetical protein PVF93_12050, partial [Chromatiaceae bacterium]
MLPTMGELETLLALLQANADRLLLGGVVLGLVLLVFVLAGQARLRDLLREQGGEQRAVLREVREDIGDDIAQSRQELQETVNAGLMRLQDLLDQRIGALQRQALQDAAALKTELIERFE